MNDKENDKMKKISEKIETPVSYEYDVAVVGGGVAGISAALAAARSGARVALVESTYTLGGLATSGLVTIYLPLCDGEGTQVSFGIAEELLRLSIQHGAEGTKHPLPTCWLGSGTQQERRARRYDVQFNPWFFAMDTERILLSEGVKLIYGASVVSVAKQDDRITHLIIEGRSGREAIAVSSVVDATGDAVVAYMSGARCAEFPYGNKLAAWYYYRSREGEGLTMLGVCDDMTEKSHDLTGKRYRALSTEELTDMMIDSHASTYADLMKKRERGDEIYPTAISSIPQVRMTRRIVGKYTLDDTEIRKSLADSVGVFSDWRKRGPVYELSFGALCTEDIDNLFAAGRCISSTDDMWDITRVIPVCAVSGEAAGVAAALLCEGNLDIDSLQQALVSRGVKIHI